MRLRVLTAVLLVFTFLLSIVSATEKGPIVISKIEDLRVCIEQNNKFQLPAKVTAIMSNNITQEVPIKWSTNVINTKSFGNYTYEGTVNGYKNKVKLYLNISTPIFPIDLSRYSEVHLYAGGGSVGDKLYKQLQGIQVSFWGAASYDKSFNTTKNTLYVISSDEQAYNDLPLAIKKKVSLSSYLGVESSNVLQVDIDKANVLIINKSVILEKPILVYKGSTEIKLNKKIFIRNNAVMFPLEEILKALNASYKIQANSTNITIINEGKSITINKGSGEAALNGKRIILPSPTMEVSGVTYIPLFLLQELIPSNSVEFNSEENVVVIAKFDKQSYLNYQGDKMLTYDYMVDNIDSDRDDLSDYEEIHKYLTNPNNRDSDSDGIIDSDWNERKEYTYTITARRELNAPFNTSALHDTFQDIKVISETKDKLVYELVLYPYAEDKVSGDTNWKKNANGKEFAELLRPRKTSNWDLKMQQDINKLIPINLETDLEAAKFLVYFLRYGPRDSTGWRINPQPLKQEYAGIDLMVDLRFEVPIPFTKERLQASKVNPNVTDSDYIDQILFGKRMFYDRSNGQCTASATLLMTAFRSIGIPTRIIETHSLLDCNDPQQFKLLDKLTNLSLKSKLKKAGNGNHYRNEAFIGGRWIVADIPFGAVGHTNYDNDTLMIKCDTYFDQGDRSAIQFVKNFSGGKYAAKVTDLYDTYGKHGTKSF